MNIIFFEKHKNSFFLNVCCVLVFYVFLFCSVFFSVYGPFCHCALNLDMSTLFTTFSLWTSLQFIMSPAHQSTPCVPALRVINIKLECIIFIFEWYWETCTWISCIFMLSLFVKCGEINMTKHLMKLLHRYSRVNEI